MQTTAPATLCRGCPASVPELGLALSARGALTRPLLPLQDYELQLVTYKAQVEPVASPAKKPKVQSASDSIIQEVRAEGAGGRGRCPRGSSSPLCEGWGSGRGEGAPAGRGAARPGPR